MLVCSSTWVHSNSIFCPLADVLFQPLESCADAMVKGISFPCRSSMAVLEMMRYKWKQSSSLSLELHSFISRFSSWLQAKVAHSDFRLNTRCRDNCTALTSLPVPTTVSDLIPKINPIFYMTQSSSVFLNKPIHIEIGFNSISSPRGI